MYAWLYLVFFFFQAEDGIRDYKVTGVQTCALPIFPQGGRTGDRRLRDHRRGTPCLSRGTRRLRTRQRVPHRTGTPSTRGPPEAVAITGGRGTPAKKPNALR